MALTTIIVGVDLSAMSDQALERAVGLALQHRAKLVVVHALSTDEPIENASNDLLKQLGEVSAAVHAESARRLAEQLVAIKARGVDTELVSRVGPPAELLATVAEDRRAELLVVATHGATGISRFLLGSVATATLRLAPCDVLVCRGPTSATGFKRPLVATDFSPAATRALTHTAMLADAGAPIEIIHAWQLPAGSWGATLLGQARFPWSTVRDAVLSSAKSQADKLVAAHANLGHPLHVELVQGPAPSVITHAAEQGGHDLIAVGTHGHSGFRRLLLGSVAESTIRHAPCSVLVAHGENAGETARFRKQ